MSCWIIDASPLILLGKINRIDLLEKLAPTLLIPFEVRAEILAGPDPDPAKVWIQRESGANWGQSTIPIPTEVVAWDLGVGESAVIALGISQIGSICILEDLAARNCAQVFGLPVMGTLGVLIRAKRAGIVPALRPEIDRLVLAGSLLSPSVIENALALAEG